MTEWNDPGSASAAAAALDADFTNVNVRARSLTCTHIRKAEKYKWQKGRNTYRILLDLCNMYEFEYEFEW